MDRARREGPDQIPALQRIADLERDPEISAAWPALRHAASVVATPPLRNAATIGGNLCLDTRCAYYDQGEAWREAIGFCLKKDGETCWVAPGSPRCWAVSSSDTAPILCALGAEVSAVSAAGERRLPVADLFADDGARHLTLAPGELLTALHLPAAAPGERAAYLKVRRRASFDFPVLGIAARVRLGAGAVVEEARVFLGGVASRPLEAREAGAFLVGRALADEEVVREAAALVAKIAKPMQNTDLTASWRKRVAAEYAARALRELGIGFVAYALFFATILYTIGFVGNVAVPKSIDSGETASVAEAVSVNLLLLAAFGRHHTCSSVSDSTHSRIRGQYWSNSSVRSLNTSAQMSLPLIATNIRYRDGSYSNFNSTDLNGFAGFNEIFPLFNWLVLEADTTRYKQTGVHVVYDAGGPADGTPGGGTSTIAAFLANTLESSTAHLPVNQRFPGSVYCSNADCSGFSILNGPGSSTSNPSTPARRASPMNSSSPCRWTRPTARFSACRNRFPATRANHRTRFHREDSAMAQPAALWHGHRADHRQLHLPGVHGLRRTVLDMMGIIYGMALCVVLCVVFVLFVRMKSEGEGGCGHNCAGCHSDNCSIAETHHEQ